jgi:hypothetical protein
MVSTKGTEYGPATQMVNDVNSYNITGDIYAPFKGITSSNYMHIIPIIHDRCLRLGPHERIKCVRCIACRDVLCRNRKKPIDLNIRGTRALLHGSHDVR